MLFICLLQSFFSEKMQEWGFTISNYEFDIDENLPNFFEAVKLVDADWIVEENQHLREVYGFQVVPKTLEECLDDTKVAKKPVRGVAWYNLLANPRYCTMFNYIEAGAANRSDLIVDGDSDEENDCEQSDMVKILINMAYAPKGVVEKYTFGNGISVKFKKELEASKKNDKLEGK